MQERTFVEARSVTTLRTITALDGDGEAASGFRSFIDENGNADGTVTADEIDALFNRTGAHSSTYLDGIPYTIQRVDVAHADLANTPADSTGPFSLRVGAFTVLADDAPPTTQHRLAYNASQGESVTIRAPPGYILKEPESARLTGECTAQHDPGRAGFFAVKLNATEGACPNENGDGQGNDTPGLAPAGLAAAIAGTALATARRPRRT